MSSLQVFATEGERIVVRWNKEGGWTAIVDGETVRAFHSEQAARAYAVRKARALKERDRAMPEK